MNKRNSAAGFSLIELMIVVAIVGILSSIAVAWYGDSIISANRTEARSALSAAAGTLEKCRSLYGTYTNANCNYADFTTDTGYYDITAVRAGSTFTLTATPVVGSPQDADDDCTTLTLTNTGIRNATGADTSDCW